MKQILAITIGICCLATAGATAISSQLDAGLSATNPAINTSVTNLTAAQTKALQEKFRYWPASNYTSLKTPI